MDDEECKMELPRFFNRRLLKEADKSDEVVDQPVVEYDVDEALDYVFYRLRFRCYMNKSQLGMAVARLAIIAQGGDHKSEGFKTSIGGLKIEHVAKKFGTNPKAIEKAKTVLSSGVTKLIKAVDNGTLTVSAAARILVKPVARIATGQQQSQRLLKQWGKTSEEGRELFKEAIKGDDQPTNPEA
jgi:hypothetical protein